MAAMAAKTFASVLCLALVASACGKPARTATNFCRQLAKDAPALTHPTVTSAAIACSPRCKQELPHRCG